MDRVSVRVAAAVLGCLVSACASERPGPRGMGPPGGPGGQLQESKSARPAALLFTGMDANRDLVVSSGELAAGIDAEFARADVDRSGVITGFQLADWCRALMGDPEALPDLCEMDTDMNYTVTRHEFATALEHAFERMDKSVDGLVTREEMLMDTPHLRIGGKAADRATDSDLAAPAGVAGAAAASGDRAAEAAKALHSRAIGAQGLTRGGASPQDRS